MALYDLLAACAAALLGVFALWMVARRSGADRGGPRADLVRYAGVASLAALVCAVMNIFEATDGALVAAAVGNSANVFAPGMLWAGARRLNARRDIGAVTAGAASLLMLAVTFVVPADDATLVKTAAVGVFSALAAVELQRPPLRRAPGSAVMAIALMLFALYNGGRLIVAFGSGMHSWVWNTLASSEVTAIVSAVVILVISAAALPMGRGLADDPTPGTRAYARTVLRVRGLELLQHPPALSLVIRVPELHLIRAAHGLEHADAVMAALLEATRRAIPDAASEALSRETVVALLADAERAGLQQAISRNFKSLVPASGEAEVPDLHVVHRAIADAGQLDALLDDAGDRRPRGRAGRRRKAAAAR